MKRSTRPISPVPSGKASSTTGLLGGSHPASCRLPAAGRKLWCWRADQTAEVVKPIPPLVPVELAGYLVQADTVADGSSVRTGRGEATGEPALYERLHLGLGEPVAHLHGRVAGDGGEDVILAAEGRLGTRDGREGDLER